MAKFSLLDLLKALDGLEFYAFSLLASIPRAQGTLWWNHIFLKLLPCQVNSSPFMISLSASLPDSWGLSWSPCRFRTAWYDSSEPEPGSCIHLPWAPAFSWITHRRNPYASIWSIPGFRSIYLQSQRSCCECGRSIEGASLAMRHGIRRASGIRFISSSPVQVDPPTRFGAMHRRFRIQFLDENVPYKKYNKKKLNYRSDTISYF